jgi:hypothetical protein
MGMAEAVLIRESTSRGVNFRRRSASAKPLGNQLNGYVFNDHPQRADVPREAGEHAPGSKGAPYPAQEWV